VKSVAGTAPWKTCGASLKASVEGLDAADLDRDFGHGSPSIARLLCHAGLAEVVWITKVWRGESVPDAWKPWFERGRPRCRSGPPLGSVRRRNLRLARRRPRKDASDAHPRHRPRHRPQDREDFEGFAPRCAGSSTTWSSTKRTTADRSTFCADSPENLSPQSRNHAAGIRRSARGVDP
jgi:hypothetical protein